MQTQIVAAVVFVLGLILVVCWDKRQKKRAEAAREEKRVLQGIEARISEQLYDAYEGSRWRWVSKATDFAKVGGTARIEVIHLCGTKQFMDVCFLVGSHLTLQVINATDLSEAKAAAEAVKAERSVDADASSDNSAESVSAPASEPMAAAKPLAVEKAAALSDDESVRKWYEIVLSSALGGLVKGLNAKGELSLYIDCDGKAYTEEGTERIEAHSFGKLPDIAFWEQIVGWLSYDGYRAEIDRDDRLFLSWA